MATNVNIRKIVGKKIKRLLLNPRDDGKGGKFYDPSIHLEGGLVLYFTVQETEVGEYGIEPGLVEVEQ